MIRIPTFALFLPAVLYTGSIFAQALPSTNLWLASVESGVPVNPVKISMGDGYNNQPHFSEDGSVIFYTREMTDGGTATQTDIAAFHTGNTTTTFVNSTPESEYSPTPIPGRDALSVIQTEADQKQRLWAIDLASGEMELLLRDAEPVGYHAWINQTDVAMFILGESFTLQTASLSSDDTKLVADNIGRSIRKHPQTGEVLFVDKNREPWQIAAFDPQSGIVRGVMPLFPGNEDFTIDRNGSYWSGNGGKLYRRTPGDTRWELMADFTYYGIKHISRLAIHMDSNQIAMVSD